MEVAVVCDWLVTYAGSEKVVEQISRSLLPYNSEKQPIFLLQKNSQKIELQKFENQILSSSITDVTTKYILYFPGEI